MDHGHPDFKELEVPNGVEPDNRSIKEYICELGLVPTWSERFMTERIKWEKLEEPKQETVKKKISELKSGIKWRRAEVKRLEKLLK